VLPGDRGSGVQSCKGWVREWGVNKVVGAPDDTSLIVAMVGLARGSTGKLGDGIAVLDAAGRMASVFRLDSC